MARRYEAIGLLDSFLDDADISDESRSLAINNKALAVASRGSRSDTEQALELLQGDSPPDTMKVRNLRAQAFILDQRNGPGDASN